MLVRWCCGTYMHLASAICLVVAVSACQTDDNVSSSARIESQRPGFHALVPVDAKLIKVADGFTWVEGPVWHPSGRYLLVSDIPANSVFKVRPNGEISLFLTPSGYTGGERFTGREPGSNGLTFDLRGRLVLSQHGDRRIVRLLPNDKQAVLIDRYEGRRLNSPNDLVYSSSGDLYFTDPPFGLPDTFDDPAKELSWSGVYRLRPDGQVTLLTTQLRAPNGIALSPDERTLYVSNADRANAIYVAFDLLIDGSLAPMRTLHDAAPWTSLYPGAPDGMKVDVHGNIFAAGPGGVHVLAPDGTHLGSIITGVATSNVAWGGDGSDLYITAGSAIYRIGLTTSGRLPHWHTDDSQGLR